MATTRIFQGSNLSRNASTTTYHLLVNNGTFGAQSTAPLVQTIYRTAGTLANLYVYISQNDRGASTYKSWINGSAGNLSVSITASGTGGFEDTSNSDSITAGDAVNAQSITGAGGSVFIINTAACDYTTSNNVTVKYASYVVNVSTASTTYYAPFAGGAGLSSATTTEAYTQITQYTAATLANLHFQVITNGRSTTTTVRSRVNGGDGNLVLSIAGGTTGSVEDTSNSDSISSGDLCNFSITLGTGTGSFVTRAQAIGFTSTSGQYQLSAASAAGVTINANLSRGIACAGDLSNYPSAIDATVLSKIAATLSKLECYVSSNGVSDTSTLVLRINGSPGNQTVSITGSTTGLFKDTTNSDSITATDTIYNYLTTGATGTNLTLRYTNMLVDVSAVTPVVNYSTTQFFQLLGIGT